MPSRRASALKRSGVIDIIYRLDYNITPNWQLSFRALPGQQDFTSFFDNTGITPWTTFVEPSPEGVRYLSLGSYGASPLGAVVNESIAGPDMKTLPTGRATFVAIPIGMSHAEKQAVERKAGELGYNVMPLARYGSLFPGDEDGPRINPFLIYRNKVATTGFAGDIQNVPCFRGRSFDNAPWVYAASPANMGEYAPIGVEWRCFNSLGPSFS